MLASRGATGSAAAGGDATGGACSDAVFEQEKQTDAHSEKAMSDLRPGDGMPAAYQDLRPLKSRVALTF